ncbi:MAG: ribonucleotide-diphosphate reductase subunit beta, partial [Candidatus Midichloria mitochondrii]|nr:ribonucleotide-diphosphate reductase subunit beta [Candidatus Midichloria mitochondrii]
TNAIIWLFKTFIAENPELWNKKSTDFLYEACETIIKHEDAFIDLAFSFEGAIEGMTASDIKQYIRYIADRRLTQLGLQ